MSIHNIGPSNDKNIMSIMCAVLWLCCWARGSSRCRSISCPHDTQQQTRRTSRLRSYDGTDRETGGRTLDRYIDPALRAMRAV